MRMLAWIIVPAVMSMTGLSARSLWQSPYAPGWVAVAAVIEESRLGREMRQSFGKGGAYTANVFRLEVVYRYNHHDFEHRGVRINLGSGRRGTSEALLPALGRYTVGTRVTAWMRSEDPTQSVLERGASSADILLIVLGPVIACLAYWLGLNPVQGRCAHRRR